MKIMQNINEFISYKVLSFRKNRFSSEIEDSICSLVDSKNVQEGIRKIVRQVNKDGFFMLDGALSADTLALLKVEYDGFFDMEDSRYCQVDRHDGAVLLRVMPFFGLDVVNDFPHTSAFFNSVHFKKIAEFFYKVNIRSINYMFEVFIHNTVETKDPLSGGLHWDRWQTLKFWVYLNDIEIENGPMRIVRGSSKKQSKIRRSSGDPSQLRGQIDNLVLEDDDDDVVYLTGSGGSILIQDTDASHGSTVVLKDKERKIFRGHCRLK